MTCPNNDSADNRSIIASTTTNNYVFTTSSYAIDCDQTLMRRVVIYHYQNTMQKKSYLMILIKNRTFEPGNKLSRTEESVVLLPLFCHFSLVPTAILPNLIVPNDITHGIISLRVVFWRSRPNSFLLRCTFLVIKTRSSSSPCFIWKPSRRSRPESG